MFFNKYPNTNFHELNLDWIIAEVKKLHKDWDEFKVVNTISFSGLWTIERAYQEFTIVDTPDHNGFISIRPVPIGVNIDNENYWRQVANYSELYAEVQNRIVGIEKRLDKIDNKTYIIQADSYGLFGWTQNVVNRLGLNASILNNGGCGFYGNDGVHNWKGYLEQFANTLTPVQREEYTDIIVMGGVNDFAPPSFDELVNLIKEYGTYCLTAFPNATIQVGVISGVSGFTRPLMASSLCMTVIPAYQKACSEMTNMIYIPNMNCAMHNTSNLSDDEVHPNEQGTEAITNAVCNYIKYGVTGYTYAAKPVTWTIPDFNTSAGTIPSIRSGLSNDVCYIEGNNLHLIFNNPISFTGDGITGLKTLGTIKDTCCEGILLPDISNASIIVTGTASVFVLETSTFERLPYTMQIYNGHIDIAFERTAGAGFSAFTTNNFRLQSFYVSTSINFA